MNTPNSERARLLCRVVRLRLTLSSNAAAAQRSAHVSACPACQKFFARAQSWESDLRRTAGMARQVAPSGLNRKILEAMVEERAAATLRRPRLRPGLGLAVLAAGAAAAVVFIWNSSPEADINRSPEVTSAVAAIQSLSSSVWRALPPAAVKLAGQNPVQDEIDSARANAQSALDFLAVNFLPAPKSPAPGEKSAPSGQNS